MAAQEFLPESLQYSIAKGLHDRGFLRIGDTELTDGSWSPYYIDLHGISSFDHNSSLGLETQAGIRDDIVCGYSMMVEALGGNHVIGIPEGGLTIAGMVGHESVKSVLQMSVRQKQHGHPAVIRGDYYEGESVLLIDDVIKSGATKRETVQTLADHGLLTSGIIAMVDREQGGVDSLLLDGIQVLTGISISTIVNILRECGRLPKHDAEIIRAYTAGEITTRPS